MDHLQSLTIAMIKISIRWELCACSKKAIFLHNIGGNELQRWVQHFPLHRAARTSTSSFSFDDLVTCYIQNCRFYPISTADYSSLSRL